MNDKYRCEWPESNGGTINNQYRQLVCPVCQGKGIVPHDKQLGDKEFKKIIGDHMESDKARTILYAWWSW
jgi:hypothetical protein